MLGEIFQQPIAICCQSGLGANSPYARAESQCTGAPGPLKIQVELGHSSVPTGDATSHFQGQPCEVDRNTTDWSSGCRFTFKKNMVLRCDKSLSRSHGAQVRSGPCREEGPRANEISAGAVISRLSRAGANGEPWTCGVQRAFWWGLTGKTGAAVGWCLEEEGQDR